MTSLSIQPLGEEYSFGSTIAGLTEPMLDDPAVREELMAAFEERGLLVFRGVEGHAMQLGISRVFGPLKEHPLASVRKVEGQPLIVDMKHEPGESSLFEIEGEVVSYWLPWHFDHCYNDTLNRGGVLRAVEIVPEGGKTAFLDGAEAWDRLNPELKERAEGLKVLYRLELDMKLRFGRPKGYKVLNIPSYSQKVMKDSVDMPRAVHPMVFERASDGRKVLHVSPWMEEGIEGHEDAEGEALLGVVIEAMIANATPYCHSWRPDDMLAWDNWRMLHAVTGNPPQYTRAMQRTTILGDYGLGHWEHGKAPVRAAAG
jgi:taurine dioxygenase